MQSQPWHNPHTAIYETYQEMFEKEALGMAVVCLPYARNAQAIASAAEAGAHILSEKPVAINRADLEMVQQAVKRSGVRLSAMFAMQFTRPYFTIRHAVAEGSIGLPCHSLAKKSYKWGSSRPWFYRHLEIFGSTILWAGLHAVDLIRWTMGLEVTEVSALHGNLTHPDYPAAQDHAIINMQLENGATAAVTVDYLRPAGASTHSDNRLHISGSDGIVEKRTDGAVQIVRENDKSTHLVLKQPPSLFADFVAELRGQATHLIGPDEAIRVTRICVAATEAARSGRMIRL